MRATKFCENIHKIKFTKSFVQNSQNERYMSCRDDRYRYFCEFFHKTIHKKFCDFFSQSFVHISQMDASQILDGIEEELSQGIEVGLAPRGRLRGCRPFRQPPFPRPRVLRGVHLSLIHI